MIHHVSIPAENPRHVSEVLAELMGGKSYPFPGGFKNSFMAVSGDPRGTAIEVYPTGLHLRPDGIDMVRSEQTAENPGYSSFHLLLSVDADQETVERIGNREGWLTRLCARGAPGGPVLFHVIEVWLENRLMVEVAPKTMIGDYEKLIQFEMMDRMPAPANA
jgi:hypothetical protein